ncbi:MAG: hypothetical protein R6X21_03190 [Candidatus Aminicenantes bacterium]
MRKLSPRFHGVLTLALLIASLLVGLVAVALKSAPAAVLYGLMVLAGLPTIVYLFCGKCVCRGKACLMVLPGRLSFRLPPRKTEAYTKADFAGILGTLTLLALFPQYWLWQTKPLFIAFLILILAAHAEVMLFVCRACENCRCPVYKWFRRKRGLI